MNENSEIFNFGVKDGVRGFFTNPSRADDSFIPFSSCNILGFELGYNKNGGIDGTVVVGPVSGHCLELAYGRKKQVGIFFNKNIILVKYMPKNGSNIHGC